VARSACWSVSCEWSSVGLVDVVVPRRGRHPHPRGGACLMEMVSSLTGGRWTDRPRGVDKTLAELARAVNDHTSGPARIQLLPLMPWLVHPSSDASGPMRAAVTAVALTAARGGVAAPEAARPAGDVLSRSWWSEWRRQRRAERMVRRCVRQARRRAHADELLRQMLIDAVNAVRAVDGLPPVPADALRHLAVDTLSVSVWAHLPDGSESRHYHGTAVLDRWPAPLVSAWAMRCAELRRGSCAGRDVGHTAGSPYDDRPGRLPAKLTAAALSAPPGGGARRSQRRGKPRYAANGPCQ